METIYWTYFQEGQTRFLLAATARGLCFTGALNKEVDELEVWAHKKYKQVELVEDAAKLQVYIEEFAHFMCGNSQEISCPLDVLGTMFQQQVWDALQKIPYGEVVSYQDIADRIGRPTAVRAVGGAIGANPVMIRIPCHRVIGKNGALTGFRGGMPMKELLLTLEREKSAR